MVCQLQPYHPEARSSSRRRPGGSRPTLGSSGTAPASGWFDLHRGPGPPTLARAQVAVIRDLDRPVHVDLASTWPAGRAGQPRAGGVGTFGTAWSTPTSSSRRIVPSPQGHHAASRTATCCCAYRDAGRTPNSIAVRTWCRRGAGRYAAVGHLGVPVIVTSREVIEDYDGVYAGPTRCPASPGSSSTSAARTSARAVSSSRSTRTRPRPSRARSPGDRPPLIVKLSPNVADVRPIAAAIAAAGADRCPR